MATIIRLKISLAKEVGVYGTYAKDAKPRITIIKSHKITSSQNSFIIFVKKLAISLVTV